MKAVLRPARDGLVAAIRNTRLRMSHESRGVVIGHHAELSHVEFGCFVNVAHHVQIADSKLGDRTSIGRYSKVRGADIGKFCSISWDVTIGAVSHPMDHPSSHAFWYRRQFGLCEHDVMFDNVRVSLGNDVWVGCGAVVMPGVCIGDGAVIGAGAVVTKDVAPYAVVAGSPAKQIKQRFSAGEIERLQALRWWDWPDEMIQRHITDFFSLPFNEDAGARCD